MPENYGPTGGTGRCIKDATSGLAGPGHVTRIIMISIDFPEW